MVREVLSLHIGQAGVQMGTASWELYCLEHDIGPNGIPNQTMNKEKSFSTFFQEVDQNRYVPRAVFVDLEPSVIDEIRVGRYKELFHPDQMINGKEDAANNYARGKYTVGHAMVNQVCDTINKVAEGCGSLQGIIVTHSLGGGTGSGFTAALTDSLMETFNKKSKIQMVVYPAPQISTSVVEPYNSILTTASTMNFFNVGFLSDNEAVFEICKKNLGIARPDYINLNRVIAQAVSCITASLRFGGSLNVDLNEYQTNLVPFPKIHFPLVSYAPIASTKKSSHDSQSVLDLTSSCFDPAYQFVKCDPKTGRFMACCLLYRGDVSPKDANSAINTMKTRKIVQFVSWCPTGFKIGLNQQAPVVVPGSAFSAAKRALCMLSNTSAIHTAWGNLNKKIDILFKKRAFMHWYVGEGMEEAEMNEAYTQICDLEQEYLKAGDDDASALA